MLTNLAMQTLKDGRIDIGAFACRWAQGQNTCPICRAPFARDALQPRKLGEHQEQEQQRDSSFDDNMIATETGFRLGNLQLCVSWTSAGTILMPVPCCCHSAEFASQHAM